MVKMYWIKKDYIINAERYLDKLKYFVECEFEKHIDEIDKIYEKINALEEALWNAKSNAQGYNCRAIWKDYEIIKDSALTRELMDNNIARA